MGREAALAMVPVSLHCALAWMQGCHSWNRVNVGEKQQRDKNAVGCQVVMCQESVSETLHDGSSRRVHTLYTRSFSGNNNNDIIK